jgi:hypothetical protein
MICGIFLALTLLYFIAKIMCDGPYASGYLLKKINEYKDNIFGTIGRIFLARVFMCVETSASDYLLEKINQLVQEDDIKQHESKMKKLVDLYLCYMNVKSKNTCLSSFFEDEMNKLVQEKDIKKNTTEMRKLVDLYSKYTKLILS